ncbi:MAG: DUF2844 domain-containing protein [Gammaproteobacteria bacterium]|nr:DUF2844 domain-containing protein [Gammaproteobacteria bacterium]MBU1415950.1 DUF2844 domain-containing protein [Gammaproteobacteria bacterium]
MRNHVVPLLLALSSPAFAGLGGNPAPVAVGGPGASVAQRLVPARPYTVRDIRTGDGGTIREYVSAEGKVFGVAWAGPTMPDLRELFGEQFEEFREGVRARRNARGPVSIARPNLVVQSGGHMRAFRGRAWLPQLLPAGVSGDEIK